MFGLPQIDHSSQQASAGALRGVRCAFCREVDTLRSAGDGLLRCLACRYLLPAPNEDESKPFVIGQGLSASFAPGSVLRDRYRLVAMLGRGVHGVTFKAHHLFLNHPCALKVLPHRIDEASDGAVRRLRSEASAGFRVNHPNVVRVLDGDVVDGIWYFATEYVDGVDLGAAIRCRLLIDWRQATKLAIDAARGLDAIHSAGLIHRDIKPGNLILGVDGRLRIADLGVAHLAREQAGLAGTVESPQDGTLAYAAPEVLANAREIDARADLYSLGATLYELVSGRLPRGVSVYRTLLAADHDPVSWPRTGRWKYPTGSSRW